MAINKQVNNNKIKLSNKNYKAKLEFQCENIVIK